MTTAPNPIDALIRTALADLQPRIEIAETNVERLTSELASEKSNLTALRAQDSAYRAALPADTDEPVSA